MSCSHKRTRTTLRPCAAPRRAPHPDLTATRNAALNTTQALLTLARTHGMEIVVVLPPYHARYLALIRDAGRAAEFTAWKAALKSLVADARAQGSRVRLIDAATSHAYANEPVPARGDHTTQMQYYWESGHFKKALGDLLIGDIVRANNPGAANFPPATD